MIRCGIAGWYYSDWRGPVYPERPGRDFDRLAFLARFVDVIEVNSSFYRPLRAATSDSWVRRTGARLVFTAKAHRSLTHGGERALVDETVEGLRPLREAGVFGALLLQFPQRFHRTPAALEHLERLSGELAGWPLVVEVRHRSWADESVVDWLDDRDLGWCAVDQPRVDDATLAPLAWTTSPIGYLRVHGRNAANWFRPDAGRDARYDYLYRDAELEELTEVVESITGGVEEMFVVQNNHFRGQALVNTLQLKHRLTGKKPPAPASLVRHYPVLAEEVESVDEGQGELF